jgi:ferredoxin
MLCNKVQGNYLKCTEACPTGALKKIEKTPENILLTVKMGTAEIDKSLCYSYNNYICGTCYRACPFPGKAMTLGMWEKPEINEKACVGCGLCERSCILYPQAIRVKPRTKA